MSFELALKLSSYLLVLDGFFALWLTHLFDPLSFGLILSAFVLSWWSERFRGLASKRLWDGFTILFLLFLFLDLFYLAPSFAAGVIHLLVFISLYKLFNRRSSRDYLDLYIVSFFQLVATSAFTINLAFFLAFVVYLVFGTWTFILLHLRKEAEAAGPSNLQALLGSARLFSRPFLLTSLGVSLGAFFLTAAFFLIIPRVGKAYLPLSWRQGTMATGFSEKVELGAFGNIQTDPTIIMRIRFPDLDGEEASKLDLHWRGIAFDHFDGRSWSLSDSLRRIVLRQRTGIFRVRGPKGRSILKQEIYLEPIGTETLFAAPRVVEIAVPSPALLVDELGSVALPAAPSSRIRYLALSTLEGSFREVIDEEAKWMYLQLPELPPRIQALARSIVEGAKTPSEKARRVEAYLKEHYRYSLELKRDPRLNPLEDFLFQNRQGNCEYFAASMAVLLRSVNVPARVVNGFQRGEWNEFGGYYAVRQKDAHSWVEVYIENEGWVTFDPSPRAEFEARASRPSGFLSRYLDALRMRWNRYVIDYNLGDQLLLAIALKKRSEALREEVIKGLTALTWGLGTLQAKLPAAKVLLGLVSFTILLFLALRLQGRPNLLGGGLLGGRLYGRPGILFYERALKLLAKKGFTKKASCTPREFARELRLKDEGLAKVEELFELYYRVRYGGRPLSPLEEAKVKSLLAQLAATKRSGTSSQSS